MKQMSSAVSAWLHLHVLLSNPNEVAEKMIEMLKLRDVSPETLIIKELWIYNSNQLKLINGDNKS